MADILNVPVAGGTTSSFNTGLPLADVIRDIPYGIILLDKGVEFNSTARASKAAFIAKVDEYSRAARGSRAYPFWGLKDFEDKSKDPVKGATGNLDNVEIQLVDGIPSFDFSHRKGELFHNALIAAESSNLTLLIVDKKYVVYGTKTSGGNLAGFSMAEFKCHLPKFQTPSGASKYPFSITLESMTEVKENGAFIQCDSTLVNVSGIVPVTLAKVSFATNVLKVSVTTLGGTNLAVTNNTNLTQATAWIVKNVATGVACTVVATYDSTLLCMILTLSGAAFTGATAGDLFSCTLAAASVLEAAPISLDGYEAANTLSEAKP